jgi:hypothetical protein
MPAKIYDQTPELVEEILNKLMDGESLRSICRPDHMPSAGTFLRWCSIDEKLSEQYARARDIQMDYYVDDINQIADDCDIMDVAKAKLRIDTRKWTASKLKPKKYGDKIQNEVSGEINFLRIDATDEKL